MKVLPFKIPKPKHAAFIFQTDINESFYDKLHQHEEIQLSLIIEGEGTLVIGDTVNYYSKGDVLVIGSHLPHVFKSDTKASKTSKMLSLFFIKSAFGDYFFDLEELKEVDAFFKRAKYGFKITSNKEQLLNLYNKFDNNTKFDQFLIFLEILKICSTANYTSLSSFIYDKKYSEIEGKRMRDIFEYTMTHFNDDITLNSVADVANMTKNAFCKYFKKRTNKTYFQFLNELRIEHACKLLIYKEELQINEIADLSGYKNLSNFNRQFKILKQLSPSDFRKNRN
ncbi:AraC family transcriptional regulator [Flavivirga spongiicola]|uniref:AraC family transcriptional regulator n=1 Tax=Flavivirga spongiicola TaxID=421621 RepID=A0ABU7XNZ7_9FLAO|nr:AraC family transcriptional regulator [Flavivirga sp. MEBiC05379]MDO5977500.1 AraC family transcriptional regulator [Flavivirga sp. MEBiC05379]